MSNSIRCLKSVAIVLLSIAVAGNAAVASYAIVSGVYWTIPINVAMIALCLVSLCLTTIVRDHRKQVPLPERKP